MLFDMTRIHAPKSIDGDALLKAAEASDPTAFFFGSYLLEGGFERFAPDYSVDENRSLDWIRLGANTGDPLCIFRLGLMSNFHLFGTTTDERKNSTAVIKDVLPAVIEIANAGNLYAQAYRFLPLWHGIGTGQNRKQAINCLTTAVEGGDPYAQFWLAGVYEKRIAVKPDNAKGLELYTKAAQAGLAIAQEQLGTVYHDGGKLGVKRDLDQAKYLLKQAAEQGQSQAMVKLADMYFDYKLAPIEETLELYQRGAARGNVLGMLHAAHILKARKAPGDSAKACSLYIEALDGWIQGRFRYPPTKKQQDDTLGDANRLFTIAKKTFDAATNTTTLTWPDRSEMTMAGQYDQASRLKLAAPA